MQIAWIGADGSSWDLTNGPVRLDKRPLEGFGDPEWVRSTRTYAGLHGQRRTAPSTAKPRSGFIPFFYVEPVPSDRVDTAAAWWSSWDPDQPGTITATKPDGSYRFISACFDDDNSWAPNWDPYTRSTEKEGVSWIADDPWWRGPTIVKQFGQPTAANFFGTTGYGPPFYIGSSNVLSTATLENPGDRPSAPRYTIDGPITSFDIAVDGHHLAASITLDAGQHIRLDASPEALSADLIGADGSINPIDSQLTSADYALVPPGASVPLSAVLVGGGGLTVELDPLYRRAW
jgi:hypothetical protein